MIPIFVPRRGLLIYSTARMFYLEMAVRIVIVVLLLLSHVVTIGVARCTTVWHEPHAHAEMAADHEHNHGAAAGKWAMADHEHEDGTPDHTHVGDSSGKPKVTRRQPAVSDLILPPALVEVSSWIAAPADQFTSLAVPDSLLLPLPRPPLAGRTSHLLF
jgi:hypothetical protein